MGVALDYGAMMFLFSTFFALLIVNLMFVMMKTIDKRKMEVIFAIEFLGIVFIYLFLTAMRFMPPKIPWMTIIVFSVGIVGMLAVFYKKWDEGRRWP